MPCRHHSAFNERSFWPVFCRDLAAARCLVLMQSPFLSISRLAYLSKTMYGLVTRGVTICAFVKKPWHWHEPESKLQPHVLYAIRETRSLVRTLEEIGAHVTLRSDIHEKLVAIDDRILWDGSLNVLSHKDTSEHINRWTSPSYIRQVVTEHGLDQCRVCQDDHRKYGLGPATGSPPEEGVAIMLRRLSARRRSLKLAQAELAKRCQTSQALISRLEGGKSDVRMTTFLALAQAVELEPVLIPRLLVPSVMRLLKNASHHDA